MRLRGRIAILGLAAGAAVAALAALVVREDAPAPEAALTDASSDRQAGAARAPGTAPAAKPFDQEPTPLTAELPAKFDVVRVAPDGLAVIAGRAPPGATVEIKAGELTIGVAEADRRGEWVIVPAKPLPTGPIELRPEVVGASEAARAAADRVVIVVPERRDGAPDQTPAPVLVVRTSPAGGTEVLQGAGPDGPPTDRVAVTAIDYGEGGQIVMSGSGPPGATVQAYVDDRLVASAEVDAEGRWRMSPAEPVATGRHQLRVDRLVSGGAVRERVQVPFVREERMGRALAAGEIIVQPGDNLWQISRATYGAGIRYTIIYRANRSQIMDPDLIYPGQVFELPKADGEG